MQTALTLDEKDWDNLLRKIRRGECTPFIGAGACTQTVPLAADLARQWAKEHGYPLCDSDNLARVAQFLAIDRYPMFPKEDIQEKFERVVPPDFAGDEPHGVLADLGLPIYITTNYDSFMYKALESRGRKPQREFFRWNDYPEVMGKESILDTDYRPGVATPLVYHLHGYLDIPQSMVLTEDDYLDFVIRLSGDLKLMPADIRTALAGRALLFVGYGLADWSFRVLLRSLLASIRSLSQFSVAVQLAPPTVDTSEKGLEKACNYLSEYLTHIHGLKVRIYWGDARKFAQELSQRWKACQNGN